MKLQREFLRHRDIYLLMIPSRTQAALCKSKIPILTLWKVEEENFCFVLEVFGWVGGVNPYNCGTGIKTMLVFHD